MDVNETSVKVSGQITTDDQDKLRSKFFELNGMFFRISDKNLYYVDDNEA